MIDTFRFNSSDEVTAFENILRDYANERSQFDWSYVSLAHVYNKSQTIDNGLRIFYSYFDIILSIVLLYSDIYNVCIVESDLYKNFSSGQEKGKAVFEPKEKFLKMMDMNRYRTSFILRYRALWDKVMGFLILIVSPTDYGSFCNSKSKKKSFRKIAKKHLITQPYLLEVIEILDGPLMDFDDNFRTPEAHGTGTFRKWASHIDSAEENPEDEFRAYWNMLNRMMHKIRDIFDDNSKTNEESNIFGKIRTNDLF